jgi:hypothetical protein
MIGDSTHDKNLMEQFQNCSVLFRSESSRKTEVPKFAFVHNVETRDNKKLNAVAQHTVAVHVGTPPPDFREWSRTNLYFHRFEDYPAERSISVSTAF